MNENLSSLPKSAARDGEAPLESWKEIGAYLQKDITTVRRWEKKEGLPVHRHNHESRSSVYAYPSEIDRWRAARRVVAEIAPPAPSWRRVLTPAFALTMTLCLVMVGNGFRPQAAFAEQTGQTRTMLCSGSNCDGRISPDGKSLLVRLNDGIGIRELATNKVRTLVEPAAGARIYGGIFSPDGSRIAYTRMPAGPFDLTATETLVVNVTGTGARTVYRGGSPHSWSADGKRLLLEKSEENRSMISLLWLNVADGSVQKLPIARPNLDVTIVSPDGRYIAFNASKDQDSEENVYIVASDGSGETLVSASPAYQEPVAWTPDGKRLVYGQYQDSSVTLWAALVADGKVQGPAVNTHAEFEKRTLFVGVARSGALYYRILTSASDVYTATMDPSTGKVTGAPVPVSAGRTGRNVLPRWAPDSRQLAYNWSEPVAATGRPSDVHELSVYSFDNGKEKRVAAQEKFIAAYCWSGDGSSILLNGAQNPQQPQVVRFNIGTGQITPVFPAATFTLRSCSGDFVAGLDKGSLTVRSVASGVAKEIHKFGGGTHPPLISHDGRSVAFIEPSGPASVALRVMSSDGGPVRDLAIANTPAEFQPLWGMTWSPDDRFLYFARRPDSRTPFELFRIPAAGGAAESVGLKTEDIRDLNIAPDGTRIAFSIGAVNQPELWSLQNFLPSKK